MKKTLSLAIVFVVSQLFYSQNFNHTKSLRVDFQLTGDLTHTQVFFTQMKEEPFYGGSTINHIMPQYGEFLFQLTDIKSGKVLFSKGFNSLYGEWIYSRKPNEKKLFYHAIQTPFPTRDMILNISQRQSDGNYSVIGTDTISPENYFIKKEKVKEFPIQKIIYNGHSSNKVDIAVIAEGYTVDELDKFYADVRRLTDYMFTIPPYDKYKAHFNIYAIGAASLESGTDIPGKHIYKNTLFNSSFYTFDMERYLTSNDMATIADAASLVPYDQIYVLANTFHYGGAGFYNHINLASADNQLSPEVFVHEFGHSFVGLADEYYSSSTSFDTFYNPNVEPWEPNITTLVNFEKKWKQMLDPKTPIPTPRIEKYKNTLGVFEGGGYSSKGVYSPVQDCRMKTNQASGFCPVCSKAIKDAIDFYIAR